MSDPATIVIPLSRPCDFGPGLGRCTRVVLREPRMHEYARIGEPVIFMPNIHGFDVPIEMDEVIEKYLSTLVVEPDMPALLGRLHLVDAIRVKEALLSFFLDCREEGLRKPVTSSSSASDGSAPSNGTI